MKSLDEEYWDYIQNSSLHTLAEDFFNFHSNAKMLYGSVEKVEKMMEKILADLLSDQDLVNFYR